MARKRMVSPDLLTSESVAKLPIAARYGFVGLWSYLDDEGRGKDNSSLITAHIWPLDDGYTTRKVESDVLKWVVGGMVCRYETPSGGFLHCPKWWEWQKINHPTPSRITPCPIELLADDPELSGKMHDQLPEDSRNTKGVLLEDSLREAGILPPRLVEVSSDESSSTDRAALIAQARRAVGVK